MFSFFGRIFALATVLSSVLIYNLPETVLPLPPSLSPSLNGYWLVNFVVCHCRYVKLIYLGFHLPLKLLKSSMEGLLISFVPFCFHIIILIWNTNIYPFFVICCTFVSRVKVILQFHEL
jgi:hypothetical protein